MDSLVSVIIPIYHTEKYLSACLDSLISQTFKNLELILVIDESSDMCLKIVKAYQEKDSRIKSLFTNSANVGQARNLGITAATGDYIAFPDSDDLVSRYYIENMLAAALSSGSEVVVGSFRSFSKEDSLNISTAQSSFDIKTINNTAAINNFFYSREINGTIWGKLFKASLVKECPFPQLNVFEETTVLFNILLGSDKISIIPCCDYFYRIRKDSLSHNADFDKYLEGLEEVKKTGKLIKEKHLQFYDAYLVSYIRLLGFISFSPSAKKNKAKRKEMWSFIKKNRKGLLKNKNARSTDRAFALLTYSGFYCCRTVYNLYSKR